MVLQINALVPMLKSVFKKREVLIKYYFNQTKKHFFITANVIRAWRLNSHVFQRSIL